MIRISLTLIVLVVFLSSCFDDELYYDKKLHITSNDRMYAFSKEIYYYFKEGDTNFFKKIDKNDSIMACEEPEDNTSFLVLYPHISNYKKCDNILFITQIPNKYLFNIPDSVERRFIMSSYSFMDPDKYHSKMREIVAKPELHEYYYYDNSKTTLYGPYKRNEISKIAESMGYSYPD